MSTSKVRIFQIERIMRPLFLKVLRFIIPAAIFIFLGSLILRQWDLLEDYSWDIDIVYALFAFFFLLVTFLLLAILFRKIFYYLDVNLSLKKTFKIFFISNLGRYMPGKIWQFVGMYYLLDQENIGKLKSVSCVLWANILINLAGLVVGLPTLYFYYYKVSFFSLIVMTLLLSFLFIIIQPKFINSISHFVLRKMNKEPVNMSLPSSKIILLLLFCCGIWFFYGLGFFLLANSVTDIEMNSFPLFVGSFAAAHIIGFMAFFAPGGLGVREGALTYMLSLYLPLPVATIISVLARIWFTLGEVVCVMVSLKIKDGVKDSIENSSAV